MKRENIKRNIATVALVASLVAGGTGIVIEENIDHTEEYCPFCSILGMEHQANVINNSKKYDGYTAEYLQDYNVTQTISAFRHAMPDGTMGEYMAPVEYSLNPDHSASKTIHYDECVRVTNTDDGIAHIITRK